MLAYFVDVTSFLAPQTPLLIAQIVTTYLLEDTATYVNKAVSSILAFWCVFMFLAYTIPVFYGIVIGLA